MGADTNMLSLTMIKAVIWAKMISMAAILKMTSYRKFIRISGHTIVFFNIKNMGVDTKILSLVTIKAEIWEKDDFNGGHFENDIIPEVPFNFWEHRCTP